MPIYHEQPKINTPCPSCGNRTLFIDAGGHLTCSFLGCKQPSVERKVLELEAQLAHMNALAETYYEGWNNAVVCDYEPTKEALDAARESRARVVCLMRHYRECFVMSEHEIERLQDENGILRREVLSVSQANERICLERDELKENQERARQTIIALGLEILKQQAVVDVARGEIARLEELICDYYTVPTFPTDQFIRLALGDDKARELGIVIEEAKGTGAA